MDELRIDSHKLIYHVDRVSDWQKGKDIFPIFMDVSVTSACNHACIFCGLDYSHKNTHFLKTEVIKRMVKDAASRGLKSIMYAGEGEPLMHKDLAEIIAYTKKNKVDVSLATNGVLMNETFLLKALKNLTWMRVSVDAGKPETYAHVHSARKEDFKKLLGNIEMAVKIKRRNKYAVTIGTQFILLEQNAKEAEILTRTLKQIGVDYLIIKPYSKHPLSLNKVAKDLDYSKFLPLARKLEKYSDANFKLIFRKNTMEKRFHSKPYKRCLGAPFWAYVCASGDIYPCHTYLGVEKFSFGNLNQEDFISIWKGRKRKSVMDYFNNQMDARKCRELCRLDEINKYLWQLKNPHPHVNFI